MIIKNLYAQRKKRSHMSFARKFWASNSVILGTVVQGLKRSERWLCQWLSVWLCEGKAENEFSWKGSTPWEQHKDSLWNLELQLLQSLGSHGGGERKPPNSYLSACLPAWEAVSLSAVGKRIWIESQHFHRNTWYLCLKLFFFLVHLPKGADRMQVAWNAD